MPVTTPDDKPPGDSPPHDRPGDTTAGKPARPDDPRADAIVLTEGPAAAHTLNATYERIALAIGQATENAVQAQQQIAIVAQSATVQGVASLLSLPLDRLASSKATHPHNPKKEP
jgi:killing trait domain-containing protein